MNSHICLVANTAWSMWNFRRGVIAAMLNADYRVTIVSPEDESVPKIRALGCDFIHLDMSAKGVNPIEDIKLMMRLAKIYRSLSADFIIHYTIKPNIYGSLAARYCNVPSLAITTGLGYTFVNDNLVSKVARCLYKIAFRFPKSIWFLNEDDRSEFVSRGLVPEHKTMVLHGEGVDTEYFSPLRNPNDDGKIRFLLVARMLWDKGVGEYVEAARHIKAKCPNTEFQLLGACGVANPSNIGQEQINEWVNEGVVEYLGTTQDVRPIIAQAACVVLPSYREGIPRTMIEAAAMAKPIIVSSAPGCRDVVIPETTGLMCDVKNAHSLVQCMETFLSASQKERDEMGLAGRKLMMDRFDEKIIVDNYLHKIPGLVS
ncbi:glycosyltransferase family 4 protein [Aeromonas media]|uniref:glycosyltransferase family 4 protein n=1 Tax=Aeromonas media TaxID=651 RepID=UPI003D233494